MFEEEKNNKGEVKMSAIYQNKNGDTIYREDIKVAKIQEENLIIVRVANAIGYARTEEEAIQLRDELQKW